MKLCREKIRKAKAKLEHNLATVVKENRKHFYKYINCKRMAKENLHPLLELARNVITQEKEKLRFSMSSLHQSLEVRPISLRLLYTLTWKSEMGSRIHPTIQMEAVRELLLYLDCHKSIGPDGIQLQGHWGSWWR